MPIAAIELPHLQLTIEQFFISVAGIPRRLALWAFRESTEDQGRRLRKARTLIHRKILSATAGTDGPPKPR